MSKDRKRNSSANTRSRGEVDLLLIVASQTAAEGVVVEGLATTTTTMESTTA
jgi:hypothetical protein